MTEFYGYFLYAISLLTMGAIYAVLTLGLNVQWGFAGLFNAGIAGFFAIGAYTTALLTTSPSATHIGGYELPYAVSFLVAMLISGLIAWAIGKLCLKLRSDYLAIATVGVAEIFRLILRTSHGDRAVLLATFGLTVLVDLTVAIEVGMVLAAFVFMHRMAGLASMEGGAPIIEGDEDDLPSGRAGRYMPNHGLPADIGVLTFRGPLFFGSAAVVKDALDRIGARKRVYILRLEDVPLLDPTGAFALGDLLKRLLDEGDEVLIVGAGHGVLRALLQTVPKPVLKRVRFVRTFEAARKRVLGAVSLDNETAGPPSGEPAAGQAIKG